MYKVKNYSDLLLYNKSNYDQNLFKFVINAKELDKNSESYKEIEYNIRRVSSDITILKTLESKNVSLLYQEKPLPRSFKVFAGKDVKNSNTNSLKIYIDISDIIYTKNGNITINNANIDKLVAYLGAALCLRIYYSHPEMLFNSNKIMESSTYLFTKLFSYIIDYLRCSGTTNSIEKVRYMSSMYFQIGIMGREYNSTIERRSKIISKISDNDISKIDIIIGDLPNAFKQLDQFIEALSRVLNSPGLKLDVVVEKWIMLLGSGTQFSLEYFPALSKMITDTYFGSYLNNQKTIEKICGNEIVNYVVELFNVGKRLE